MNGNDVFNRLLEVYQTCSMYEDSGELVSAVGNVRFKTYFCRPDDYRFEWSIGPSHTALKSLTYNAQDGARMNLDGMADEHVENLALAIAGATGTSWGVAPLAAHLLLPDLFQSGEYKSLASMAPYEFVLEDQNFKDSCYKIRANHQTPGVITLLVDKTSFVLRHIENELTPTLKDKERGIRQLKLQNGSVAELEALEAMPQVSTKLIISYIDVKLHG